MAQGSDKKESLLIVEDDNTNCLSYERHLKSLGYDTQACRSAGDALKLLGSNIFNIAIVDMHLPDEKGPKAGLDLLKTASSQNPNMVLIGMSSDMSLEVCDQAKENGALYFIRKPIHSATDFAVAIKLAKEHKVLLQEHNQTAPYLLKKLKHFPHGFVISEEQEKIARVVSKHSSMPIVIYGETGTGKEILARLIHKYSEQARAMAPFVAVNCATLSKDLMASLMFGHKKGAFSGADSHTVGFVGEAHGGILFLDEIHMLTPECQGKLLQVLNNGTYTRLGDTATLRSNFQPIIATTKDLDEEDEKGNFLLDLRSRLIGMDIYVSPLRENFDLLSDYVNLFFINEGMDVKESLIKLIEEKCRKYYWQGNVRQLYKVLKSFLVHCELNECDLDVKYFPEFKTMFSPEVASVGGSLNIEGENSGSLNLQEAVEFTEKNVIERALARHNKIQDAAAALGVSRNTLDLKRKKYGLM